MEFFTKPLPQSVTICEKEYPIRTDFKTWVEFDRLMTESNLPLPEKIAKVCALCFVEKELPPNLAQTISALFSFYAAFLQKEEASSKAGGGGRRVLSFTKDAPYIYAAFLAQYNMDLLRENPHWFLFRALFASLNRRHKICEIMGYRARKLSDIKDKSQRAFYRKMKKLYQLPDTRPPAQIEQDTIRSLEKLI